MRAALPNDTAFHLNSQPHCWVNLKCCMTSYVYSRHVYLGKGRVKCSTDNDDYTYPRNVLWMWGKIQSALCYADGENIMAVIYCILVWEQQCWQNLFTPPDLSIFISCITEWGRGVGSVPVFIFRRSWFWILAQTLSITVAVFEFVLSPRANAGIVSL